MAADRVPTPTDAEIDAQSEQINALRHEYDDGGWLSNVVWNVRNRYSAWPDHPIEAGTVRMLVDGFLAEVASLRASGGEGQEGHQ